jgi:hypothetical protein
MRVSSCCFTSTSVGTPSWSRNRWSSAQRAPPSCSAGTASSRATRSQRCGPSSEPARTSGYVASSFWSTASDVYGSAFISSNRPVSGTRKIVGIVRLLESSTRAGRGGRVLSRLARPPPLTLIQAPCASARSTNRHRALIRSPSAEGAPSRASVPFRQTRPVTWRCAHVSWRVSSRVVATSHFVAYFRVTALATAHTPRSTRRRLEAFIGRQGSRPQAILGPALRGRRGPDRSGVSRPVVEKCK